MEINKISQNNNFNGLHVKVKEVEYLNKYIRPIEEKLRELAQNCDVYISKTNIPQHRGRDYIIAHPAIQVLIKPLLKNRLNPFSKLPRSIKAVVPVKEMSAERLQDTVAQRVEAFYILTNFKKLYP